MKATAPKAEGKTDTHLEGTRTKRSAEMEAILEEKNDEIDRLTQRLAQALEKLHTTDEVQSIQHRVAQVELENNQLQTTNVELEKVIESMRLQGETSEKQIQSLKEAASSVDKEYAVYKDKAKGILKMKDQLILSLKKQKDSGEVGQEMADPYILSEIGSLR
jgi:chromosome segregation ATPase